MLQNAVAVRCGMHGANVALMDTGAAEAQEISSNMLQCGAKRPMFVKAKMSCDDSVSLCISKCERMFGGIDALVYAANSRVQSTLQNSKITYSVLRAVHPLLQKSELGHLLGISPPILSCRQKWLQLHPEFATSAFLTSMIILAHADKVKQCNTLWPAYKLNDRTAPMFSASVAKLLLSDFSGYSGLDERDVVNWRAYQQLNAFVELGDNSTVNK